MAIISQRTLFCWEDDIENLGDLERLQIVLDTIPDEELMETLEKERGKGRNRFPIRAIWNSILAALVFQHLTVESLIRELQRNVQLRYLCGFGMGSIPNAWNYSRFLKSLIRHLDLLEKMFDLLVDELKEIFPDFGKRLAIDSKNIQSFANRKTDKKADGRRDVDADTGIRTYRGVHKDGTAWEKIVKCFGYKLHLIVDSEYELPVAYEVTAASKSDVTEGHKLVENLAKKHEDMIETCEYLSGDKGYDDTKLIKKLREMKIRAVIDTRQMWKGEKERPLGVTPEAYYDEKGNVYCFCKCSSMKRTMCNNGFEEKRNCLRKACPAEKYAIECESKGKGICSLESGIRIPLEEDERIFTAVDRSSYKWEREYKHRTAVERVNSRLDVSFGFEKHTIRGRKKMEMRCGLALVVMLTMAVGRIKQKRPELMRSLVKTA